VSEFETVTITLSREDADILHDEVWSHTRDLRVGGRATRLAEIASQLEAQLFPDQHTPPEPTPLELLDEKLEELAKSETGNAAVADLVDLALRDWHLARLRAEVRGTAFQFSGATCDRLRAFRQVCGLASAPLAAWLRNKADELGVAGLHKVP